MATLPNGDTVTSQGTEGWESIGIPFHRVSADLNAIAIDSGDSINVSGTITDTDTGDPASGISAKVQVLRKSDRSVVKEVGFTTDSNGEYSEDIQINTSGTLLFKTVSFELGTKGGTEGWESIGVSFDSKGTEGWEN